MVIPIALYRRVDEVLALDAISGTHEALTKLISAGLRWVRALREAVQGLRTKTPKRHQVIWVMCGQTKISLDLTEGGLVTLSKKPLWRRYEVAALVDVVQRYRSRALKIVALLCRAGQMLRKELESKAVWW